jgi:predicted transcriptional regulator
VKKDLKPPCMVVVAHILPALRVEVAQQLMREYGMRPIEAASKMGVTPAAITQYVKGARGRDHIDEIFKTDDVKSMVTNLAIKLANNSFQEEEILQSICTICSSIRKEKVICELCKKSSLTKLQGCSFCKR